MAPRPRAAQSLPEVIFRLTVFNLYTFFRPFLESPFVKSFLNSLGVTFWVRFGEQEGDN